MQKKKNDLLQENSGLYLIEIYLPKEETITVGKRGAVFFKAGYYYYAGSAQKNLRQRIERHLRNEKTLKWHADYLTSRSPRKRAISYPGAKRECSLLKKVKRMARGTSLVKGFGCSDCSCTSHLLHSKVSLAFLDDLNPK